jgi:hypothetical protein
MYYLAWKFLVGSLNAELALTNARGRYRRLPFGDGPSPSPRDTRSRREGAQWPRLLLRYNRIIGSRGRGSPRILGGRESGQDPRSVPAGTSAEKWDTTAASGIFMAAGGVFGANPDRRPPATRVNVAYACDPRFLTFLRRHVFVR